jgi:hypothetical protein
MESVPSATVFGLVAREVRLALDVLDEWLAVRTRRESNVPSWLLACC